MRPRLSLLVNPAAGKGTGSRAAAVAAKRFRDAGIEVVESVGRDAEEAVALARAAADQPHARIVVCGGDGMVHLAVQAVAGTDVPLGIIPAGTGNDVARYLNLPRSDPAAAADVVIGGATRRIDLARAGARHYVTVLAAGFDAIVNERANQMSWPRGQMRYNLATLAELRRLRARRYELDLDGVTRRLDAVLVAVGNGPSFGGGLRITEGAEIDDGLLDVVIIHELGRAQLVRAYPRLFRGTIAQHPAYEHHRVSRVTVASPGITGYADGERLGVLPLTVECAPDALTVHVSA